MEASKTPLIDFLLAVCPPVLDCTREELTRLLTGNKQVGEKLMNFLVDSTIMCLQITREATVEGEDVSYKMSVDLEVSYKGTRASTIAFIKRPGFSVIDTSGQGKGRVNAGEATEDKTTAPGGQASLKNIGGQLQIVTLGYLDAENTPFEIIHQYLQTAVAPLFGTYRGEGGEGDEGGKALAADENKIGIPSVLKKVTDLSMSVMQCQQNVEIPEISLQVDPDIQEASQKAKAEGRKLRVEDFQSRLEDNAFLQQLQSSVTKWIKEIQKVTRLQRDPTTGTAMQEIHFWLGLEKALNHVQQQLQSPEIELTLSLLKHAKRFFLTISFEADTGLKKAQEKVNNIIVLMRDFPINDLLAATSIDQITHAVRAIFAHMKKIKTATQYPVVRAFALVEAISRDLAQQVLKVLSSQRLMHCDFEAFDHATQGCQDLFRAWEEEVRQFKDLIREQVRKRGTNERPPPKVGSDHQALQERIEDLRKVRRQHQKLKEVVTKVLADGGRAKDTGAHREIQAAYKIFLGVDVLDTSRAGTEQWEAAKKAYDDKIDRAEGQITSKLRDRLGAAKGASEMFRVFSKFNALFFRPRIRGAIHEYQSQLIQQVKDDIRKLQNKFKQSYVTTQAAKMSQLRDIPPTAGAIIWAKQLERRLQVYMRRVEDVLGKGWEQHLEGAKLKQDGDAFAKKLNTTALFDQWLKEIKENRHFDASGRIFDIQPVRVHSAGEPAYELSVNYDPQIITLFKEVRNQGFLQNRVPYSVKVTSDEAKLNYPFAMTLQESVRTYMQTAQKVAGEIAPLVASYQLDVHASIMDGIGLRWDSERLETFSRKFADVVFLFHDKVSELLASTENIRKEIEGLKTIPLTSQSGQADDTRSMHGEGRSGPSRFHTKGRERDNTGDASPAAGGSGFSALNFRSAIDRIQKILDDLNLQSFSNLDGWVQTLDAEIEGILARRLEELVKAWVRHFLSWPEVDGPEEGAPGGGRGRDLREREKAVDSSGTGLSGLIGEGTLHELKMTYQTMYLDPPVESARQSWTHAFHGAVAQLCGLPRLQAARYDAFQRGTATQAAGEVDEEEEKEKKTYQDIIGKVEQQTLQNAYDAIEECIKRMETYVQSWLQYQALWDIEHSSVSQRLGDDIELWQQLLSDIKAARSTFDNSEVQKTFGAMVIDYSQVQAKVNNKYDAWHRDILNAFGGKVGEQMGVFYTNVQQSRFLLEQVTNEGGADEVTAFVTAVQEVRHKAAAWNAQLDHLRSSQRLLDRQRFQFPAEWMGLDRVEGEWSAFEQILHRRVTLMEREIPTLKALIIQQDRVLDEKIKKLYAEWAGAKPLQGDVRPVQAMDQIKLFEQRLEKVRGEFDKVRSAKEALEMELSNAEVLTPLGEELTNLKGVWSELSSVYGSLEALKETPWSAVVPKKVRQGIEEVLGKLKNLPPKMRQYEAFEHLQETLKRYLSVNRLITEMKTEALKERHWKSVAAKLRLTVPVQDLTLGHLWEADITHHEHEIKEVLSHAQGEMALEEFLRQVKDIWGDYELELVAYQNKTRLIRGWDELFTQIDEHQNSLSSMKMSPYFKVFEEEALSWDEKLSRLRLLFDAWMDVQRKWVYLEGIFFGSADIQLLLPNEYARFRTIDQDFVGIMKKVQQRPKVLEVAALEGIQRSLDRLSELLSKIQKALGDYLEKQRSQFARFYFVGDEDLLEMIGNSKDVKVVQRHLNKMFAGITSLEMNPEDPDQILGMGSKEGEIVHFNEMVKISADPAINAWLGRVERAMQITLVALLEKAVKEFEEIVAAATGDSLPEESFLAWINKFPAQVVLLAVQVDWTTRTEKMLQKGGTQGLQDVESRSVSMLNCLAYQVLLDIEKRLRQKYEQLVTELVHQRDVCRLLTRQGCKSEKDFKWLQVMRMYWLHGESDPLRKLKIRMANAEFDYGWEYLGIGEKLVQTPLTDRCYLTLTQALHMRLGGNPFGPAGTGKTETVKALGAQMGRFVLVFCCDEAFDFQAMGRIFVGLCQVGAWGCFDEFNRLEERILSAVSEQILTIQTGLKEDNKEIELLSKQVKLNPHMGIFVTMNPGYAGRSNLPDNLKQLFREIAMVRPDKELIAQVMLYSQGFRTAERLSGKIVSLFELCLNQLSAQPHYDFGLRSLKSVLNSAGSVKRQALAMDPENCNTESGEQNILLRSVCDTLVPKLVAQDIPLLRSLLSGVFPGADIVAIEEKVLTDEIKRLCKLKHLLCTDRWLEKCLQLYQIQKLSHGNMMVGPVGSGKSSAWRVLLEAMTKIDGVKGESYVIDPKAVTKDELYGKLDPTTLEWTDGVFTDVLRKILLSLRGEKDRRHWIVFDGDVDPEWAENLNSVLDDNKLLTLPNGERLQIPPNVRIMFEVDTLKYATLATVSRCGMVWFSQDVVTDDMIFHNELSSIKFGDLEAQHQAEQAAEKLQGEMGDGAAAGGDKEKDEDAAAGAVTAGFGRSQHSEMEMRIRAQCVDILWPRYFGHNGFVTKAVDRANEYDHIMTFTRVKVLDGLFSLVRKGVKNVVDYNESHADFPLSDDNVDRYITKFLLFAICWAMGGGLPLSARAAYCREIAPISMISLPNGMESAGDTILDYEVRVEDGEWYHWRQRVPQKEISANEVTDADLVIVTVDTVRHRAVLQAWMEERKPFVLCGPPGSGKTMTLMSTLKAMTDVDMASLNFSSGSTPELLLKTFDHYCEYVKTPNGTVLRPVQPGKWLIVFCDEVNLPSPDKYGTQRVIMFMRQLTEAGGFWRPTDRQWVKLERVQFVGACNPPTDAGRTPMNDRFLRHAPLMFVDFPGYESLKQIYGTFNRGMLKLTPQLRGQADALTTAMVEFYTQSQKRFVVDMQPHYIYSPRELTRWKVAIFEAIRDNDGLNVEQLVRLYIHEGLRIFQDRLVEKEERDWTDEKINEIALENFGGAGVTHATLQRPLLFSTWLSSSYSESDREELRQLVQQKLKVFNEEELNVQLVIFDQVLDHLTRIDRVLRQPLGHLLLVGASGAGKTVLSKFVSWANGLSVFQIKAGRNYDTTAFEADLRLVMKRAGLRDDSKITFIFDESNALGPAFLERMNALLASGEVPGLFEGDEYTALINECKAAFGSDLADESELFAKFTKQVQRNLHIVFTMNPANPDFSNRQATSPALFNRCVIDWFGDWPHNALVQVAKEFTDKIDLPKESFSADSTVEDEDERHDRLAQAIVAVHEQVEIANQKLARAAKKSNFVTPRDFLDFITHVVGLVDEKRNEVTEQQQHLNVGLQKLRETEEQVSALQASLAVKEKELSEKKALADEKMQLMVKEQSEAEERKRQAELLSKELEKKSEEIVKRTEVVKTQLAEAEPALVEARNSVRSIKKSNLDEIKAFNNPPALVKLALEPVIVMLSGSKGEAVSWQDCLKALKNQNFINDVLNFDSDTITSAQKQRIEKDYLQNPSWDTGKINNASKAAGPLSLWVESQFKYAEILQSVEPLQNEIKTLGIEKDENQKKFDEATVVVKQLEERIQVAKEQYAELITQVQMIKTEMSGVVAKVERSRSLLANLSSEKKRWAEGSQGFAHQIATVVGDCLLAGAFCTYIGFFDHYYRTRLLFEWRHKIADQGLKFRDDLSLVDFLSKPSERLSWSSCGLPADDLSVENAIILSRYVKYPLVIDPSGQAVNFLINKFSGSRLGKTSFSDQTFMKSLESSLRFGTPLLVQDVEHVDPILNSVLNKETHKQGGRVLITVGDQDIDFSPMFTMFLATRDPTAVFTPDLCSRVTFVNFTVTPSSLQNQCMNLVLKSERPDVDKKRSDMLKLQGEFRVKLRELEDGLLQALSNVQGNILDDESVISSMENLKKQAEQVQREAAQTDTVMEEIERVSDTYAPLSQAAARVFFSLEQLGSVYFLYQHSLQFFLDIFNDALKDEALAKVPREDYSGRLAVIFQELFKIAFRRTSRGLLYKDRLVFALRLAQVSADSAGDIDDAAGANTAGNGNLGNAEMDLLLKGAPKALTLKGSGGERGHVAPGYSGDRCSQDVIDKATKALGLNTQQAKHVGDLTILSALKNFGQHVADPSNASAWKKFLEAPEPETEFPSGCFDDKSSSSECTGEVGQKLFKALVIQALRPDRLLTVLEDLVEAALGKGFLELGVMTGGTDELREVLINQCKGHTPLILVSVPGFDPSGKVIALAQEMGKASAVQSIAMGSQEGYTQAERAIASAAGATDGGWVLLKNVHLSVRWLAGLEKRLHSLPLGGQTKFRVILTMEMNPAVPLNLLRVSQRMVFEPPAGVRASLQRSFGTCLSVKRCDKPPAERSRLHFMLAVLHAVLLERKRYVPVGWTKRYEFSDADQQCSLDMIDFWVDQVSNNGAVANVDPSKIPWEALRVSLKHVMYGGRVDNSFDFRVLESFIDYLFTPKCFEPNFPLSLAFKGQESSTVLVGPEQGRKRDHFLSWVEKMPGAGAAQQAAGQRESPAWLGLAVNAEKMLRANQGEYTTVNWLKMQSTEDDLKYERQKDKDGKAKGAAAQQGDGERRGSLGRRASLEMTNWLSAMAPKVEAMIAGLPEPIHNLMRDEAAVQDPLFRFFDREVSIVVRLHKQLVSDLKALRDVCTVGAKTTNAIRALAQSVSTDSIPKDWKQTAQYAVASTMSLTQWLVDYAARLEQLRQLTSNGGKPMAGASVSWTNLWGGGLLFPEAYLTATRQAVAHKFKWSLEDLFLIISIDGGKGSKGEDSFVLSGLTLEGADWDANEGGGKGALALSSALSVELPPVTFRWANKTSDPVVGELLKGEESESPASISVPIYLNFMRTELVTSVRLRVPNNIPPAVWFQRGVSLLLWRKQ
uniref:Dynein heavy chain, cytoplasmic n=1 Tax=Chromera velia CCMP2878 TaxID=1169474 RepID=A0A0G4FLJ2_9ALVE|eukprot:Cvel_17636.t1-p1 / transcript=Cvel_17636.t1 / gene=Cvel_17636 / organism=Chromera_velia_CCMP2878 / gene_product=Cytoplasmic dynein 1 heavy chain 1, putative / transcript_product=Cytoplasmic dynein 1 heavy chain 1, putative / location=Cvel_scaffold1420:827-31154(-) / protein_length=4799 / sequence_SO=supercontig / SO=protein_coding / is_pseudo=false